MAQLQHNFDQLWGLLIAGKHTSLPLKDVSVQAEVKGYVLGLLSTLKYSNDSSDPVEVLFRFPVEQSQAVVGLTAVIDGRKIKAQVREKEEARAAYDDAIASGQSAAFGEEKGGDVFSISLGNLPPQKEAEIQLQLVGELPIDAEGGVRFSLPSTLKPRYTPAGSSDPLAPVPSGEGEQVEHAKVSGVYGFQLKVMDAKDIAEVTSPTHTLSIFPDQDQLLVSLSEEKPLSKDLVVLIKHKDPHEPKALVENGAETTKRENDFMSNPAVMINFFPKFTHVESTCEFIFLVDRSGSMSGSFIRSASETLVLFLKSLPEGSFFNIIGFGSRYEKLYSECASSVAYSQKTLDRATTHAQQMKANLGGTELLSPLEHIFTEMKPHPGRSRQIFVLTDGSVSNTNACIEKVKQNARSARCFTFGIGSGASTALVEGLARAGNGTAEFVKEGERLQPKVIRSLKRALQPAVTDVSVDFKVPPEFEVLQSPRNLPPVYNGDKMVVYGVLKQKAPHTPSQGININGTAVLKGTVLGKVIEHSISFTFPLIPVKAPALPSIHHLAGKALIKDWGEEGRLKEEIVKLSINSSVVSSHTAFIAIDEENTEPVSGAMKTWDIQAEFKPQQYRFASAAVHTNSASWRQGRRHGRSRDRNLQSEVDEVKAVMEGNIEKVLQRSDRLDDLSEKSEVLNSSAFEFQKQARKKKSGGFLSSVGSLFSDLFSSNEASSTVEPSPREQLTRDEPLMVSDNTCQPAFDDFLFAQQAPKPAAQSTSRKEKTVGMQDAEVTYQRSSSLRSSSAEEDEEDDKEMFEGAELLPTEIAVSRPPPQLMQSSVDLSSFITVQQADGSWKLDTSLAQLLGRSQKDLEEACPTECKGTMATVWATVLVLSLLRMKYSSQQEEWELVAMKAESWVKRQTLPPGVSLEDLYTATEKVI